MLILLPPSEGKAVSGSGPALDLNRLCLPALNPARDQVLTALTKLCAADPEGRRSSREVGRFAGRRATDPDASAMAVLGLTAGQRDEITRNAALRTAPTLPVGRVYTGVLYDALDLATLTRRAYGLAQRWILVSSAVWGAVRINDLIAPYRCSIGVNLPGPGVLTGFWRRALAEPMLDAAGGGLVIDLRSAAYATMWTPPTTLARRTVTIRVLQERVVDGVRTRSVVSHFNKATKGRLVRDLAMAGAAPRSPAALVSTLRDLQYHVEVPATGQLDLIIPPPIDQPHRRNNTVAATQRQIT